MKKWDQPHGNDGDYISSEDKNEHSRLQLRDRTISTSFLQQKTTSTSSVKTNSNGGRDNYGGGLSRKYYISPNPTVGSGATSPNDTDNTYADASLFAYSQYKHHTSELGGLREQHDEGDFKYLYNKYLPYRWFLL